MGSKYLYLRGDLTRGPWGAGETPALVHGGVGQAWQDVAIRQHILAVACKWFVLRSILDVSMYLCPTPHLPQVLACMAVHHSSFVHFSHQQVTTQLNRPRFSVSGSASLPSLPAQPFSPAASAPTTTADLMLPRRPKSCCTAPTRALGP